jgi:hypothetical protein
MLRTPAVADQFYPGDPAELRRMVEGFLEPSARPGPALLAVSPHAGYVFSGPVAGKVLSRVEVPRRVVLLGPNHRGVGAAAALMSQGAWQTPLGQVELDSELGGRLAADCRLVEEDSMAHQFEHSLEVQVPFLQVLRDDLALTPLCLGRLDYDDCRELGQSLARVLSGLGEPALMVASTDMTHYEPEERAKQQDQQALDRIAALDPRGLHDTVRGQGITMCGVLPTTVALVAALEMGADSAELVAYSNSGEVTGDRRQVVGYAGLVIR